MPQDFKARGSENSMKINGNLTPSNAENKNNQDLQLFFFLTCSKGTKGLISSSCSLAEILSKAICFK